MTNSLEKLYEKIISKIPIIKNVNPNEWTITSAMIYIAYKYKEKFGQDFVFTYDSVPSRCIEYKMTSRIFLMLGAKAGDGVLVKDYIDWFYDNYKGKRRFRSIGALAKNQFVSEFKEFKEKPITISRTKELDNEIKNILLQFEKASYIKTYGDLYFFIESLKQDDDFRDKFSSTKDCMVAAGFDFDILDKII